MFMEFWHWRRARQEIKLPEFTEGVISLRRVWLMKSTTAIVIMCLRSIPEFKLGMTTMSVNSIFLPARPFADRNHNGLQGRGLQGFLPRLQSLGKTIGFLLASQVILYCAPSNAEVTDEIRDIYEGLLIGEPSHNLRTPIYADNIVTLFYEHRDFKPAWTTRAQVEKALHLLATSEEEGLTPGDYHYAELAALLDEWDGQRRKSDRTQAQFDVLMTDGLLLYARHLIVFMVDPSALAKSWFYSSQEFIP
jgi:hypothetical protein